ncbi:2-hydroxyacid dehydrogenase [Arenibacter sp. TNZ]|jgi:D-lactate dehydrogenase|uniref:2-hydroxyacid dehydrogenase n=1 Tax=Arenibacter TaxID=178469 RepID=UPI000CD3B3D8|nr:MULTISPECIES: 2-hydroxyacid dehydrogenase [Arenibacter]MCM4173326.1 2-hydroxyacid dehydrogenase [Arenibacter sp. TNZ]
MKVAVFNTHKFEKEYLVDANDNKHELKLLDSYLNIDTTILAKGCEAICIFTQDNGSAPVLDKLHEIGVKHIALRSAGYNNVDIPYAKSLGIRIVRVPDYSPNSIAEFTVAIILALNRKLIRSHYRIMEMNYSLDGLVGFDMNGKTVGIVGTGKIGRIAAKILHGFGCHILAYDTVIDQTLVEECKATYTDLDSLCNQSDIISLHVPLKEQTHYLVNEAQIAKMKKGVMLINTGRGGLVNTQDVINGLKSQQIGYYGMDVYEEEEGLFFEDHSEDILQDDMIARLMTLRNVMITSHQAFLTDTALKNIAETTIENLDCLEKGLPCKNEVL